MPFSLCQLYSEALEHFVKMRVLLLNLLCVLQYLKHTNLAKFLSTQYSHNHVEQDGGLNLVPTLPPRKEMSQF